jgi:hypothetical protein
VLDRATKVTLAAALASAVITLGVTVLPFVRFAYRSIGAPSVARALARGEDVPEPERQGVSEYKLGFGGVAMVLPSAVDNSPNTLLRPAVRLAAPRLAEMRSAAHRLLGRGA